MSQEKLAHKRKKESTAKWFIFALIPILNVYWAWKSAEIISGHEEKVEGKYERIGHAAKKEPTEKWFAIILIPAILGLLSSVASFGAFSSGNLVGGMAIVGVLALIALVVGIYILYKLAESVSGHETVYPQEHETVRHKDRKDSTGKWFVFGIIPILNLYFLWKMSETISGHETVIESRSPAEQAEPAAREEDVSEGSERRFCPECGAEISEEENFCPECGSEL